MKAFKNGLITGLILQLAIGPVFFYIINLTLQKTILDGFVGVLAVTIVDYLYITLAILGVGKFLEKKAMKKRLSIISSIVLMIFGIAILIKGIVNPNITNTAVMNSPNLMLSFSSVFLLTIANPMTIVFFTSLFTAKAVEYNSKKRDLLVFGLATGLATFLFMGSSVLLFSLIKGSVPLLLMQVLNIIVGCLLIGYGGVRVVKTIKTGTETNKSTMTTVLCFGTFDLLHEGHKYYLSEAKKLGDKLIVVIARDKTVAEVKAKKPRQQEEQRRKAVASLPFVNKAILGHPDDKYKIVEEIKPDIICLGYDQRGFADHLSDELNKRNMKAKIIRLAAFHPEKYKSSKMVES
ncbi:LysE family transporter [Candidatus Woesearchaeota archaeon]|nr:LysE family transporter [Candidatus Woesearchaeota archaeon]